MVNVKLFGLRRTGTSWVRQMLCKNYDIRIRHRWKPWKHGCCTPVVEKDDPVVVTIRHPLAWLDSTWRICKHYYPQCSSLSDVVLYADDGASQSPLVHRWAFAYGYWLWKSRGMPRCHIVRYEDAVLDPQSVFPEILEGIGLEELDTGEVEIVGRAAGPAKRKGMRYSDYVEKVRGETYRERFTDEMLEFLRETIDEQLLDRFDYTI